MTITHILLGLLVIETTLCDLESSKFDRWKFKRCTDASFCRRFREWKGLDSRPKISVTSHKRVSAIDDPVYVIDLMLKSSHESESNYRMELFVFREDGIIRSTIDEVPVENSRKKRYRIPDGDVIPSLSTFQRSTRFLHSVSTMEKNGVLVIAVEDLYRIELNKDDFVLKVYNTLGNLIQSVNSNNIFSFEKYREARGQRCISGTEIDAACHPNIDSTDAWEEYFGDFFDSKPYGPSGVGIDITFSDSLRLYGLPEHTSSFELPLYSPGKRRSIEDQWFRLFNSDVFGYVLNSTMALYGSVPMITAVQASTRHVSGFLWLNPSETYVGLVDGRRGSAETTWVSETGVIDFFIFTGGRSPGDVLGQYHYVTGLPALPPIFGLGFHQSQWGYKSQGEVAEISKLFIKYGIPADVLWLDIQHTDGNRYFVWNPVTYGDPEKLIALLASHGRKTVAIIDPHVKVDKAYYVYAKSLAEDSFVQDPYFGDAFEGQCWPGRSSYLDFARSDVRSFWASLFSFETYRGSSSDLFVWNDMNEPSVFDGPEMTLPRDVVHAIPRQHDSDDPNKLRHRELKESSGHLEHREVHNMYGQYFHRATFEGLLARDKTLRRPFVLSRSFFAGSHKYGPIWTGDNMASWDHLKVSLPMLLSLAMSGMSFAGADVGGFFGHPSKELYIRWHQLAALAYPFYRCHAHIDSPRREPWRFDAETIEIVREVIKLRYVLLPYYYTQFGLLALNGAPLLRPLWFDSAYVWDEAMRSEEQVFFGESLLIKGVFAPGLSETTVFLPGESIWYDLFSESADPIVGGHEISVPLTLSFIPAFVKGGSIVPVKLKGRNSTKKMRDDLITLRIYLKDSLEGPTARGTLYLDDEESMEYFASENYILLELVYANGQLSATRVAGNRAMDSLRIGGVSIIGKQDGQELLLQIGSNVVSTNKVGKVLHAEGPFELNLGVTVETM